MCPHNRCVIFVFKKADWEGLCNYIMDEDLALLDLEDVEDVWAAIKMTVCQE